MAGFSRSSDNPRQDPELVMTLVVRDEEELLETNLDYHLSQGVDFVFVTDHGSTDETSGILERYEAQGVLQAIRDDEEGHHQSRRTTHMARLAAERFEDAWLMHNDADEFWWPTAGDLKDTFAAIPDAFNLLHVPRHNFVPVSDEDPDVPFHQRMTVRETLSLNPSGGILEVKTAHRAHERAVVRPGSHSVEQPGAQVVPDVPILEILHFPMRSFQQFERKVVVTGTAYETLPERGADVGRDQLKLLDLHRSDGLRSFFDSRVADRDATDAGLREGRLVADTRLADYMRDRQAAESAAEAATARRATRSLIRSAIETRAESMALRPQLDLTRAQLKRAVAERDDLKWRLEVARAEHAAAERHVDELIAARDAAWSDVEAHRADLHAQHVYTEQIAATLAALQASRVVRMSGPVRRAYYRLRGHGRR